MEGEWRGRGREREGEREKEREGGDDIFFCLFPALLSFFIGLFGILFIDFQAVITGGFFQGYSLIVLVVITLQVGNHAHTHTHHTQTCTYIQTHSSSNSYVVSHTCKESHNHTTCWIVYSVNPLDPILSGRCTCM